MGECTCRHSVDQHELEGGNVPAILQAAICRADDCTCDDWDAVEPFPGRPPIWDAVIGTDEDGNITVEAAEPTDG
jgi:hypothetical protein